ncbi:NADH-cytochrome b5 reductase-like isoform X4 [Vicugna pacos]|uniref:NADH-cytochrome b5 reductase-like isoform X4 n=1 Tax=Vicugna pacos TaxID=30538 RepID=A0ABM5EBG9_VICPA
MTRKPGCSFDQWSPCLPSAVVLAARPVCSTSTSKTWQGGRQPEPARTGASWVGKSHRGIIDDLEIQRAYTPISPANAEGYFEVLIKCYQTGLMSRYVESWRAGDTAFWRGPFGGFFYKPNQYGELLMLAAGTGLAPMVPILHSITDNADDETFITLVGCFKTFEGIYLKAFLQEQARFWNVRIFFVLSQMRKLTLRGEGTSPCRAARLGEARIWDLSLRLSDSRVPALTHCAVLPAIHPLASSIVWAGSLLVESVGWGQTSSGCVGLLEEGPCVWITTLSVLHTVPGTE